MEIINEIDMSFRKLPRSSRRGQVPIIKPAQEATRIERILEDCAVIVEDQTRFAKEAKSVQRVNEHLDAAKKAIQVAQLLKSRATDEDFVDVQRFIYRASCLSDVVLRAEFYKNYIDFCTANDVEPIGKFAFFQVSKEKFGVVFKKKADIGICAFLPKPE